MSGSKRVGSQSVELKNRPKIIAATSVVGPKEADGPLGEYFDIKLKDDKNGKDTFEKAWGSYMGIRPRDGCVCCSVRSSSK